MTRPGTVGGLSAMDRSWIAFYRKRCDEIALLPFDPRQHSHDSHVRVQSALGNLESLIRSQSRAAWKQIQDDQKQPPVEVYQQDLRDRYGGS